MKSYLKFEERANLGRKTKRWEVLSAAGDSLGYVCWWSHWRKHTFSPVQGTIYDPACLREIADFMETETKKQKDSPHESS